jgi:hypothetical protein
MGSMLTGLFESLGHYARPDQTEMMLSKDVFERGLTNAVKDNDEQFPPEFRLSRRGREQSDGGRAQPAPEQSS